MKGIIAGALFLSALLAGGTLSYEEFITDQILDGDHTYVDNSVLFEVLEGHWESPDGRWALTISGEAFEEYMSLSFQGEKTAECNLNFSYLLPDSNPYREKDLQPEVQQLTDSSGNSLGELVSLSHRADEGSGTLLLTIRLEGGSEETVILGKTS